MAPQNHYGSPNDKEALEDKKFRQLNSIKSSLSYRLGNLLVSSVLRPWMILFLPFTVPLLLFSYARERLGYRAIDGGKIVSGNSSNLRECAILFPTNGVGMGHYSRMYSLANALMRKRPGIEIVMFTTNYVLHPLYSENMVAYHLPGRKKFRNMDAGTWNQICEEKLASVFSVHKPSLFVFDGAYPYRGMLNAIKNRGETKRFWVRRINRKGKDGVPVDSFDHFDKVIVPGDIIDQDMDELKEWPIDEIVLCPPLLSISRSDLAPRGELRARLGIPQEETVALVSLGAGEINNIRDLTDRVVNGLATRGVFVILADSMLNPIEKRYERENVRVIQNFPIMKYRHCFDFAVIAGGYNSVNESILLSLPVIIFPNHQTSRDDQPGRSEKAAEIGGAIVIDNIDQRMIELSLDRICEEGVRLEMIRDMESEVADDGPDYLAENLLRDIE